MAILAIARKEWLIIRRYPSWILSMLVWPILLPLSFAFGGKALSGPSGESLAVFARLTGTIDYTGYVAIGTVIWLWVNAALWDSGTFLRNEQTRGTLESNWMTPAPRISHLLGSQLLSILVGLVMMSVAILEFRFLLGVRITGSPWVIAISVAAVIPCVYGLGLLFASVVVWAKDVSAMVNVVRGAFLIFCGVSFPLAVLPGWMRAVASALPLTYAIDAVRTAALGKVSVGAIYRDLVVLFAYGCIFLALGVAAFIYTERQARRRGTLSHY
jgi:ABC-2 type transport system permease protein